MLAHDKSRHSAVRKMSFKTPRPDLTVPHPPDPTIPHPPSVSYSPSPPPVVSSHSTSSPRTSPTSSSEISTGVEGMKITVDTRNEDKKEEFEFVHESNYLRSMLDADTPVETMATYAASKSKLQGADEVFSKVMSLGDADSDDEED